MLHVSKLTYIFVDAYQTHERAELGRKGKRISRKIKHEKDLGKAGDNCRVNQRRARFIQLCVPGVQRNLNFKKAGALSELHFKASTSHKIHLAPCSQSTDGETEAQEGGREVDSKRGTRSRRGAGWSGEGERNFPN